MNYDRGDVVLLPFPFITSYGIKQKARPALVISNHKINRRYDDIILIGITSKHTNKIIETEYLLDDQSVDFASTGLKKTSVVRCEYIMTIPSSIIAKKLGKLSAYQLEQIEHCLKTSLGLSSQL